MTTLSTPGRFTPTRRLARAAWLLVTAAAVLLYLPGAQTYYHALLVNPFSGSSFAFPWKDTGELALAFGQLGLSPSLYAWLAIARQVVVGLGCLVIATLIALRSTDRGALLIATLLVIAGTVVAVNADALRHVGPRWALLGTTLNVLSATGSFTLAYVFPDGRFAPRWFRWVWLSFILATAIITFAGGLALDVVLIQWPFVQYLGVLFIALQIAFLVASPIYRYLRDANPVQRQQMKWVMLALLAQPLLWPIGTFGIPALFPATTQSLAGALAYNLLRQTLQDFAFLLIPITIGLAIMRYRLWDIDVIIRRTLVYSVLTALLALAYFGSVVLLQNTFGALTGQRESTLITVISTLVIAALFVPLRGRVQLLIDRRFFRRKYDAARILAAFGTSARDDVDLDDLTQRLLGVTEDTLQPISIGVWLKPPSPRTPTNIVGSERGDQL